MRACVCDHSGKCFGCQIFKLVVDRHGHRGAAFMDAVYRAAELCETTIVADPSIIETPKDDSEPSRVEVDPIWAEDEIERLRDDDI